MRMKRSILLTFLVVALGGCTAGKYVRSEQGTFSVRDYLSTAYDTLLASETDSDGHRIRAQLETRAALAALDERSPPRRVPFEEPPTLAVALELLERSQHESTLNVLAQTHALRAAAELKQALGLPPK